MRIHDQIHQRAEEAAIPGVDEQCTGEFHCFAGTRNILFIIIKKNNLLKYF